MTEFISNHFSLMLFLFVQGVWIPLLGDWIYNTWLLGMMQMTVPGDPNTATWLPRMLTFASGLLHPLLKLPMYRYSSFLKSSPLLHAYMKAWGQKTRGSAAHTDRIHWTSHQGKVSLLTCKVVSLVFHVIQFEERGGLRQVPCRSAGRPFQFMFSLVSV